MKPVSTPFPGWPCSLTPAYKINTIMFPLGIREDWPTIISHWPSSKSHMLCIFQFGFLAAVLLGLT